MRPVNKLRCKSCGNYVTEAITLVNSEDAFDEKFTYGEDMPPDNKLKKDVYYIDSNRPEMWAWDESLEESIPVGTLTDTVMCNEFNLSGSRITNGTKGCCNFDSFDIQCRCGVIIGNGGNDCWQNDTCRIDNSKVDIVS